MFHSPDHTSPPSVEGLDLLSPYLFTHRGYNFTVGETDPQYIDSLQSFEIQETDIFLVSYPKSGEFVCVWCCKNDDKNNRDSPAEAFATYFSLQTGYMYSNK
jgi:hypothetical protein